MTPRAASLEQTHHRVDDTGPLEPRNTMSEAEPVWLTPPRRWHRPDQDTEHDGHLLGCGYRSSGKAQPCGRPWTGSRFGKYPKRSWGSQCVRGGAGYGPHVVPWLLNPDNVGRGRRCRPGSGRIAQRGLRGHPEQATGYPW